jgi:hypothetical protein
MVEPSEELTNLAFFALDHAVESVRDGCPLIPFLLTEGEAGRDLKRFVGETLEASLQQARAHARTASDVTRVAIAYDGYVTVDGERSDAVFVEAQDRCETAGITLAQRYRPGGRFKKFATLGNPGFMGEASLL